MKLYFDFGGQEHTLAGGEVGHHFFIVLYGGKGAECGNSHTVELRARVAQYYRETLDESVHVGRRAARELGETFAELLIVHI